MAVVASCQLPVLRVTWPMCRIPPRLLVVNQALYRRYRPEKFSEVIGQEHVTEPLSQALRSGRVSHAYLFSGPRGCGKTTSARILARCLNCATGPTPDPCGQCDSCQELGRGGAGSLDVVEIDAASHGGVDDTRELRERAVFAPARDRFKIFILDEAHMVTTQGFNALLKIVEEPPAHVKFVFATTEPEKVLTTIRSRSHHYPFRLVPPGTLTSYMAQICQSESIEAEAGVLELVVRAGGGSVRDTESVLDQLMAGSVDGQITYQGATALLGYTPATLLEQMVTALERHDGASAFAVVEQVVESGQEPRRFAEDLLERLRDLLVVAASGDQAPAALRSVPPDQLKGLYRQARAMGLNRLSLAADAISQGLAAMVGATSPRLQLELMVARALTRLGDSSPGVQVLPAQPTASPAAAKPVQAAGPDRAPALDKTRSGAVAGPLAPLAGAEPGAATPPAPTSLPAQSKGSAETAQPPVGGAAPERDFVDWEETAAPAAASAPVTQQAVTSQRRVAPKATQPAGSAVGQPATPFPSADLGPVDQANMDQDLSGVAAQWPSVLAVLKSTNRVAGSMAGQDGFVAAVNGNKVLIGFNNPALGRQFARRFLDLMSQALSQVLGRPVSAYIKDQSDAPKVAVPPSKPVLEPSDNSTPVTTASQATTRPAAPASTSAPQLPQSGPASPTPASLLRPSVPTDPTLVPVARTNPPDGPGLEPPGKAAPVTLAEGALPRPGNPPADPGSTPPAADMFATPPPADPAPATPTANTSAASADASESEPEDYAGDAGVRGLTGVPLIEQMLGGQIIKEIDPSEDKT